jgi:uncharacterized protein YndB with AHSA1/START domain
VTETAYGTLRAEDERCGVRFERLYDYTAAELWAALTDPVQLAGWMAEVPTFEAEVGGSVVIDFGEGGEVRGEVLAHEPERVLEYSWTFTGEGESVVRFELRPQERGTLLVLDHRALGRAFGVGYAAGWHAHLDMLDAALAGGFAEWQPLYERTRPAYAEQLEGLTWASDPVSPVRQALYRGDRAGAETAAAGVKLDLFDAAALGRVDRVRELLDAEPELVQTLSEDGFSALHLSCFSGGGEATRLLVERGAPLERVAQSPIARVRPLGTAVFARDEGCVRALLDAGADPNGAGEGGFVPLHTAAANGDTGLVELLLAHAADPLRATTDGRTPLDLARTASHDDCVRLLEAAAARLSA